MKNYHNIFSADTEEEVVIESDVETTDGTDVVGRVILFNDEWHTFEEVIEQIMKATGCSTSRARALTMEVHSKGKAVVFEGKLEQCLRVSDILEQIQLRTQIDY